MLFNSSSFYQRNVKNYVLATKVDCSWPFPGQTSMQYCIQQSPIDSQSNITPPVTILKRNGPAPLDSLDVNTVRIQ